MAASLRPRTPSRSGATPSFQSPPIPNDENSTPQGPRRSSFSFLRRGKSVERLNSKRSVSGGKLQKKLSKVETPEPPTVPDQAPKIPNLTAQPQLSAFGGDGPGHSATNPSYNFHSQTHAMPLGSSPYTDAMPHIPIGSVKANADPYTRTGSITNRGRYSYASSAVSTLNSPRRVRRRKDPTPFNILVAGARNCGKTSFIDFLKSSLTLPPRKQRAIQRDDDPDAPTHNRFSAQFTPHYLETEVSGERIGLTIWDSEGLERNMVDLQVREMVSFVESKFDETLSEEMKVVRSPGGVKDPHIHCVILLLDPLNLNQTLSAAYRAQDAGYNGSVSNGKSFLRDTSPETPNGLNENLDVQILRALQGKTTVIPVISKADTVTVDHMSYLKRAVWKSLKAGKFDSFESLGLEESDNDDSSEAIEDDEYEHDEWNVTPRSKAKQQRRGDGEQLGEIDEESLGPQQKSTLLRPGVSHLDTASSSSDSSFNVTASSQQSTRLAKPHQESSLIHSARTPANQSTSTPSIPFSLITPDPITTPHLPVAGQTGRKFAWGFADPYNPEHCDFMRLRQAVFEDWFSELREASREIWYEEWRAQRLNRPRTAGQTHSLMDRNAANVGTAPLTASYARREAMVPIAMMGNNGLAKTTTSSRSEHRLVSGSHASNRGPSPNPQTMLIPVASEGEVGIAR